MDEIKVAIIEDHAIVRQGLRAMIDREPNLRVVGEAFRQRRACALALCVDLAGRADGEGHQLGRVAASRRDVLDLHAGHHAGEGDELQRAPRRVELVIGIGADWIVDDALRERPGGLRSLRRRRRAAGQREQEQGGDQNASDTGG